MPSALQRAYFVGQFDRVDMSISKTDMSSRTIELPSTGGCSGKEQSEDSADAAFALYQQAIAESISFEEVRRWNAVARNSFMAKSSNLRHASSQPMPPEAPWREFGRNQFESEIHHLGVSQT